MTRNLCLFDLDDTLIPFDSDHAWGEFIIRLGWVEEAEFRRRARIPGTFPDTPAE